MCVCLCALHSTPLYYSIPSLDVTPSKNCSYWNLSFMCASPAGLYWGTLVWPWVKVYNYRFLVFNFTDALEVLWAYDDFLHHCLAWGLLHPIDRIHINPKSGLRPLCSNKNLKEIFFFLYRTYSKKHKLPSGPLPCGHILKTGIFHKQYRHLSSPVLRMVPLHS